MEKRLKPLFLRTTADTTDLLLFEFKHLPVSLMRLPTEDGLRINGLKRISGSAHFIHKVMLERPIGSPNSIQEKTQRSPATVNACLRELEKLGIVKEITGQKRNRLYSYVEDIQIMNEGTELPQ